MAMITFAVVCSKAKPPPPRGKYFNQVVPDNVCIEAHWVDDPCRPEEDLALLLLCDGRRVDSVPMEVRTKGFNIFEIAPTSREEYDDFLHVAEQNCHSYPVDDGHLHQFTYNEKANTIEVKLRDGVVTLKSGACL
ncbi:hypothetical protein FOZ60_011664 [Perkinsus olseni]|uniref:Uncharacterized protein n=1 Tax=Perkinsus olseni TaxID=32597 RepID=A0A7J6NFF3_PEROL|nr:hypothetical protein FOZ60_011664 [Perkinsus olseni]